MTIRSIDETSGVSRISNICSITRYRHSSHFNFPLYSRCSSLHVYHRANAGTNRDSTDRNPLPFPDMPGWDGISILLGFANRVFDIDRALTRVKERRAIVYGVVVPVPVPGAGIILFRFFQEDEASSPCGGYRGIER